MKKLFTVLLALSCGTHLFAQFGNPLIQTVLMSPNPVAVGQISLLTADVRNNGSTDITAGCALVTISLPSAISGVGTLTLNTGLSDPIWTLNNYGSPGVIVLKNSGGILPGNVTSHPIVLNVSADAPGGPSTVNADISLNLSCTGLGNTNTADDHAQTTLIVSGTYTWTGASDDVWSNTDNWSTNVVPTANDKAIIPNVVPDGGSLPKIYASTDIRDIQLDALATVTLNNNQFTINGAVTGSGTITASSTNSKLIINGNAGTLNFTVGGNSLRTFTLNTFATATLGSALDIVPGTLSAPGTLTVNNSAVLTTGGNLTIKSNVTATARVGISAGTISGDVTVERFIATTTPTLQRAWHLLSTNTTGSQTIYDSWQEGGSPVALKGTWLTSGSSLLPGFDATSVNGASILIHDQTVPSWTTIPVANTNSIALSSRPGYFLFVRGDRTCTPGNSTITVTTLRSKGGLKQGTQAAVVVSSTGSGRTLVGNPYASAINMEPIFAGTANLDPNMMIWDPALTGSNGVGGYRSIVRTSANNYTQTPVVLGGTTSSTLAQYINSGQAFFLKATGADANVVFTEAVKSITTPSGVGGIYNPIVSEHGDQTLIANLMIPDAAAGTNSLLDGIRISYNPAYKAAVTDDIEKMGNFGENISSYRNGTKLIVERRPMIVNTDTIFLRMTNTTAKDYRFQIGSLDFVQTDATAYLEDTYLKTKTKLDLTGTVNYSDFSITADPASANGDRFRIIFALKGAPVPTPTIITLHAAQQGGNIAVDWKAANQNNMKQYEVEKSTDGINFSRVETQNATGIDFSTVNYKWLDLKPVTGDNIYRILYSSVSGEKKYSETATVNIPVAQPEITIYPNPVTNRTMTVRFANMKADVYQLRLVNADGQTIFIRPVTHTGGIGTFTINMNGVVGGNYNLEIIGSDKSMWRSVKAIKVLN